MNNRRWLAAMFIGVVLLLCVAWLHWRIKGIEVQVAEIHTMLEALLEWQGFRIE